VERRRVFLTEKMKYYGRTMNIFGTTVIEGNVKKECKEVF